jgi:murein DD-endopeptidase MepM/ murein hydrolase activator NlpD
VTTPKVAPAKTSEKVATPTTTTPVKVEEKKETTATSSSYATPVHGILTQGRHDATAVDFGVPTGTIVSSFKDGTVIVAKSSGYNGGYGSYIVINHEGSCQTQYSHLSSVKVSVGDKVSMGETIGLSGNTGRSTGPHLHFNVNNCGGNPFFKYKVGTKF